MVLQCINIRQVPSALVFNISHGAWRMLMHEKPCLIPILFDWYEKSDTKKRHGSDSVNNRFQRNEIFYRIIHAPDWLCKHCLLSYLL